MEILKKPLVKDITTNIIYLLLIIIYFAYINTQGITLASETLTRYTDISSMIFLVISIIMIEIGFRKEKTKIFINGIEFLILAIFTILIKHMPKVLGYTIKNYTETLVCAYIAYYILKSGLMYTKTKQDQLKELSDIKDIVKEEPMKKQSKRKNKKEEGK